MSNPLNPQVPKGQFAIIQVELRTGIVLTIEGVRYTGQGERFLFFETLDAASKKSRDIIRLNPEIECAIQDDQNRQVATIRDESHVGAIREQARKAREQKQKWWKFW